MKTSSLMVALLIPSQHVYVGFAHSMGPSCADKMHSGKNSWPLYVALFST